MAAGGRHQDRRTGRLTLTGLRRELASMPTSQASALRVLHVADDTKSSAADLAEAVAVDPVLTAQAMRLANSAYYGLSRRVRSAEFAVSVLGFATIRSLAASFAAGTLHKGVRLPEHFWGHAAATAVGTAFVSTRLEVNRAEAFSLGLLHDLGGALLCRHDPGGYAFVEADEAARDSRRSMLVERDVLGIDHADAGAVVLEAWRFPAAIVDAIAAHHDHPTAHDSKQRRALAAGQALAELSDLADIQHEQACRLVLHHEDALRCADISPAAAFDLSRVVRAEAHVVATTFQVCGRAAPEGYAVAD